MDNPAPLDVLLAYVNSCISPDRTYLIGIDGGAGSGKTTFTKLLAGEIRKSSVSLTLVHLDNFFRPSSEREQRNAVIGDLDRERLRDQVGIPIISGNVAHFRLYDWPEDCLKEGATIGPGGVVIIDGVTSTRKELSQFYDLRIWLSCSRDTRATRLLGRGNTPSDEIAQLFLTTSRFPNKCFW